MIVLRLAGIDLMKDKMAPLVLDEGIEEVEDQWNHWLKHMME